MHSGNTQKIIHIWHKYFTLETQLGKTNVQCIFLFHTWGKFRNLQLQNSVWLINSQSKSVALAPFQIASLSLNLLSWNDTPLLEILLTPRLHEYASYTLHSHALTNACSCTLICSKPLLRPPFIIFLIRVTQKSQSNPIVTR